MRDLLPPFVLSQIRDRYLAGVADAEAKYDMSRGDEDALTGALGQAISTPGAITTVVNGVVFRWSVSYRKVRGRGRGAPEKKFGTDGIFEIDIRDEHGQVLRRKGLPFQSKKGRAKGQKVVGQARDMIRACGNGLVVEYTPSGYSGLPAAAVADSTGKRAELAHHEKALGQWLANDFLDCSIGQEGLYFDPDQEQFVGVAPAQPMSPGHIVSTEVVRLSGPADRS